MPGSPPTASFQRIWSPTSCWAGEARWITRNSGKGVELTDFNALAIDGRIATPGDADWDEARSAWNLDADQRPAAVAIVESAGDVATVARFAAENGLNIAGQGTGHGAGPMADALDGAILVKTQKLRGIGIEPETETARVEAGVLSA